MERFWQAASNIVTQQAGVRVMPLEEIIYSIRCIAATLYQVSQSPPEDLAKLAKEPINLSSLDNLSSSPATPPTNISMSPEEAITENKIYCLVCGKGYAELTTKHLKTHGLTPPQYREQFGYAPDTELKCKKRQNRRDEPIPFNETYGKQHGLTAEDALGEETIICLECGQKFKSITAPHLKYHGLTPEEYKERWGYDPDTSLMSKSFYRGRSAPLKNQKN